MPEIYFISGHLDLSEEEFAQHYAPRIEEAAKGGASFVIGDARGADQRAQRLLHKLDASATIYHMQEKPRHNEGELPTVGGYCDDETRDAAMTLVSTQDIAWVRPGREKSGTAKNLERRQIFATHSKYWVRWFTGNWADEGCTKPAFGYWCSGYRDRGTEDARDEEVLCAVIHARDPEHVEEQLATHFPDYQLSFCEEKPADWSPGDRFGC